jgi:hypothetical protein
MLRNGADENWNGGMDGLDTRDNSSPRFCVVSLFTWVETIIHIIIVSKISTIGQFIWLIKSRLYIRQPIPMIIF